MDREPHRSLLPAALLLAACTPDLAASRGPLPLGRYWLDGVHPTQSTEPLGPPILVDVYLDGTARGVDEPTLHAALPPGALTEPGPLHLYARFDTDIHTQRPDGPVIGHLHPGALVPVAPLRRPGQIAPQGPTLYAAAFVDPEALTADPIASPDTPPPLPQGTRASRCYSIDVEPQAGGPYAWRTDPCSPVYATPDRTFQRVGGVELFGTSDAPDWCFTIGAQTMGPYLLCSASTTLRGDGQLVWSPPGQTPPLRAVEHPPGGQTPVSLDSRHAQTWLASGDTLTFLIQSEAGPQCDTWSVIRDASTLQIERRAPAPHHDTEVHRTLAPRLQSEDGRPFILRLGDYLDTEGSSLLRCQCDQDYALVWSSPDELHMLGRRIPSGTLVSYDPAEVERWYLTPAACARAAESAHERLARDPTAALELGYHLQEWALDWGATSPSRR